MPYLCPSFISRSLETTKKKRKISFLQNGSLLLEKLIASSDGKYNPFRSYSEEDLKKATNNYDPSFIFNCNYLGKWYKGAIEGRVVSICKMDLFHNEHLWRDKYYELLVKQWCNDAVTDVSISAMLSGHKNVLKLLGCCLETTVPIIVYESIGDGTLCDRIRTTGRSHSQPLPWKSRLEIAREIAHAVAYLHTAFAKPIIHRQIRPINILVDQNYVVKLSNFSSSMTIREGETDRVDAYGGTMGYMSAEFGGEVHEKLDVYNFGSLLLELLTGITPMEFHDLARQRVSSCPPCRAYVTCLPEHIRSCCYSIEEIVDSAFLVEGARSKQQHQWEAVKELALNCMAASKEERPTMVEVTKQLRQIELS